MCQYRIGLTEEYEWLPADNYLRRYVDEIQWTHLSCFFLISLANYIRNQDLDAHFSVFFNILSCLIYQTTIINIWIEQQKIPEMKDSKDIINCNVSDNFGEAREYLMYEMLAYYMQMFCLIIFLIGAEFKAKNIFDEES